ncbi:MAG: response regulator [Deltaproteobacteria bacterium]|nr:response regulator [Deltaproteobacteria bacterium]
MRQILINLVGNALKFTDAGGIEVRVAAPGADILERLGNSQPAKGDEAFHLFWAVEDTGIGIVKDHLDIIFDSFRQCQSPMERSRGGIGLGLTVCKKYVELMGGAIWAENRKEQGSRFCFLAAFEPGIASPESEIPSAAVTADILPSSKQSPFKILQVEDNLTNAWVTGRFIEELGHTPTTVTDGLQALEYLQRERFDLVLMDLQMSGLNGLETTRRLRSGAAGGLNRDVPVVAMTAHVLEEYRRQSAEAGMNDFLAKPVEIETLAAVIDRNRRQSRLAPDPAVYSPPRQTDTVLLDRPTTRRRFGGNERLIEQVYDIFSQETPVVLTRLKSAVADEDRQGIYFAAHTLKGACARIDALTCRDLAAELETGAKEWPQAELREWTDRFETEFQRVLDSLHGGMVDGRLETTIGKTDLWS